MYKQVPRLGKRVRKRAFDLKHTQAQLKAPASPAPVSALGTLGFQAPCQERAGTLHGTLAEVPARSSGGGVRKEGWAAVQAVDCWRSTQVLSSTSIPLERPSGAGGGAGKGVGKLVGAGQGRWDTRAPQEEGARVPAAGPALRESQRSSCDFTY